MTRVERSTARFRIVDRFLDLLRVGVELGRDAGAEIVHAEEGRKRLVDIAFDFRLHVLDDAERLVHGAVGRIVAGGEKLSGRIENGHVVDAEARDGRSHQMADGGCGVAADAGAGADHHRGRRVLLGLPEAAAVGHDDVDAGGGNTGNLLDGAGDFAFERADAGDFLHEGGEAERADIVEQFIAGIGAVGQAAFGEIQARLAGRSDRNLQAGAIGADFEIDIGLGKRDADLIEVAAFEPDVERLVGRLVDVEAGGENDPDCDHPG